MKTKTQTQITKTQFEMYTEIWNEIDGLIEYRMDKFNTDMEDLQKNFTHYLSWNAKAMFKYKYEADELFKIKNALQYNVDSGFDYSMLEHKVADFRERFENGYVNVRENSTNEISNACSTWTFEVDLEVFKKCKSFLRRIEKFMDK